MIVAASVQAQEATVSFSPPDPAENGREWIRMSSGEWLMGDLKNLRDDDLVFDSEDLGELKLDWDDVAELRSPRVLTYVFEDKIVLSGTGLVRDGKVIVNDGSQEHTMLRTDLLGILEGAPKEINYWSAKLGFGFIGRSGNTDQLDLNGYLRIKREAALNRLKLDLEGNRGEVNDVESINNQRASAVMDWFLYKNAFITLPAVEYYADQFQNLDQRWTAGAAVGIYPIRNKSLEWSISLGGGYQATRFESVEDGTDPNEKTGTVIPSTSLEWDLTGALELEFDYNAQISVPETQNAYHHAYVLLSVEIWNDNLNLDTSLTWDRVNNPRQREDGSVPSKDDFRTYVGFSLDI